MFDYDTKEKEHQSTRQSDLYSGATPPRTNQIASCFGALSITYKISYDLYQDIKRFNNYLQSLSILYYPLNKYQYKLETYNTSRIIKTYL
jgi:hypothetical protein